MKKVLKIFICFILTFVFTYVPQSTNAYDFNSSSEEERAVRTRNEIYDLYNVYKEIVRTENTESNQFGVTNYTGVCSTVTVRGETMTLDEYVAGVVKSESAPGNLESLKAQAIAARTFLLYNKKNANSCVINNTTDSFQVFNGKVSEDSIYYKAAKETSNMVVSRNGEIALTQYQSYPAGQFQTEDASGWHVQFQKFADDPSTKWTWNGPKKSEVFAVTSGYEMAYDNPHNWGMSQTISAYLALKEGYTYDKLIDKFYGQPIVTLSDGVYDTNLSYVTGNVGNIYYWNQQDFAEYDYGYGCGSIKDCGCGPTSVAIVASTLLNRSISPVETTKHVCDLKGCTSSGSINATLGTTLNQIYNIRTVSTNDNQDVINALGSGNALVIALMGPGLFTTGGHYIVLTGVNDQGQVSVADPWSRKNTEQKWFDFNIIISQRKASYTIAYKS